HDIQRKARQAADIYQDLCTETLSAPSAVVISPAMGVLYSNEELCDLAFMQALYRVRTSHAMSAKVGMDGQLVDVATPTVERADDRANILKSSGRRLEHAVLLA